jgi:hypothetical protein
MSRRDVYLLLLPITQIAYLGEGTSIINMFLTRVAETIFRRFGRSINPGRCEPISPPLQYASRTIILFER